MAHQVLFFRDQQMSVDQHKAFGRLFGELLVHPAARAEVEGHPEIRVVHADEKTKTATGEVWHSDMSCEPEPPMGSILYLHQSPPVGGDTAFANMYLAYETLSEPIKRLVEGLSAFHTSAHVYSRAEFGRSDKKFPEAVHPIVRTHPVTDAQVPVRQPRLHQAHRGPEEARERRASGDAGAPLRDAGVPVPLPMGAALGGVLGQPLRHAPRDVRLSPARAPRPSRDHQGRQAVSDLMALPRHRGRVREGESLSRSARSFQIGSATSKMVRTTASGSENTLPFQKRNTRNPFDFRKASR